MIIAARCINGIFQRVTAGTRAKSRPNRTEENERGRETYNNTNNSNGTIQCPKKCHAQRRAPPTKGNSIRRSVYFDFSRLFVLNHSSDLMWISGSGGERRRWCARRAYYMTALCSVFSVSVWLALLITLMHFGISDVGSSFGRSFFRRYFFGCWCRTAQNVPYTCLLAEEIEFR